MKCVGSLLALGLCSDVLFCVNLAVIQQDVVLAKRILLTVHIQHQ